MNRVIITVVGKDTVGIIAKVCTYLAESHINILDISQTIVSGFFNMMMICPALIKSSIKLLMILKLSAATLELLLSASVKKSSTPCIEFN